MSIRDYSRRDFVTSNGAVYDANQAAYFVLRIIGFITRFMPTKYQHFAWFSSVLLTVCFVHVSAWASVQLEMHGLKFE